MKERIKLIISCILFMILMSLIVYIGTLSNKKLYKENIKIINDTIYVESIKEINKYIIKYDSIENINDSLNSELFILKYKLGRIKEYNEIAAKGNNIKYLRGWINRVLNE